MIYLAIIFPVLLSGLTFIILLKLFGKEKFSFPLDFGLKFRGKRILGRNKTIKGPMAMTLFTGVYGWLLVKVLKLELAFALPGLSVFFCYSLIGLSYSLGELPNSFIKRRLSIPPGGFSKKKAEAYFFKILDIVDSLIACGLVYYCLFRFPAGIVFKSVLLGSFLHFFTDQLMIGLDLKSKS